MSSGNMRNISADCVKPRPTEREMEEIIILRCENPLLAIMPNPAKSIDPNIMMVHPPSTA